MPLDAAAIDRRRPADLWTTDGGIYLGVEVEGGTGPRPLANQECAPTVERNAPIRSTWTPSASYHRYQGEGHISTVAPQGSGKTRKLLMPNLFGRPNWSTVVIDTKGELCAHTALHRAMMLGGRHRVVVVDPFKVMEENYPTLFRNAPHVLHRTDNILESAGFNMLRAMLNPESDNFVDDAKALAEGMFVSDGSHTSDFWISAAQSLGKGLAMGLRVDRPGQSDSLGRMRDVLGLPPQLMAQMIAALVKDNGEKHKAIAASLGEFTHYQADDRTAAGIRQTAKVNTDWLDSPRIQADLRGRGGSDFDFATLKETPTTVYLILPPQRLYTHRVWLRLMITAALMPLMRSTEPAKVPVLFMLDEFPNLGRLPAVAQNFNMLRGYGIKLWTIWQSIGQAPYKDDWEQFFTSGPKIVFAPDDPTTREYFSKLSGERMYVRSTMTTNKGNSTSLGGSLSLGSNDGTSIGQHHHQERVIRPYELAALDADEAVLFMRRGQMHKSICPQPNYLGGDFAGIDRARSWIDQPVEISTP